MYPDIDFADVHDYVEEARKEEFADTALATGKPSSLLGAKQPGGAGKPVIRGETGFVGAGGGPSEELVADKRGLWLHDFIWGGINPGGMLESYWFSDSHIYNIAAGFDHRKEFGNYFRFISGIPLSNGHYEDAEALVSNGALRVWGQKDVTDGSAHLWIQNVNHTWKRVVQLGSPESQSGTVTLSGFTPERSFAVEWWSTGDGNVESVLTSTEVVESDTQGRISLTINRLGSDIAAKLRPVLEARQ